MAQVIIKYDTGGITPQVTKPSITDESPRMIGGKLYKGQDIINSMDGEAARNYMNLMEYDQDSARYFMDKTNLAGQALADGRLTITNPYTLHSDVLKDFNASGKYIKPTHRRGIFGKKKLTDEEKRANLDQDITNFVLERFMSGAVPTYTPPQKSYTSNQTTEVLSGKFGNSYTEDWWNNLSNEEKMKNLGLAFQNQAERLSTDIPYRRGFMYSENDGPDNWDTRYKPFTDKYTQAAQVIGSQSYENALKWLQENNLADFTQYVTKAPATIETTTPATTTPTTPTTPATQNTEVYNPDSGFEVLTSYLPWENGKMKVSYNGKTYEGSQIADLEKIPELVSSGAFKRFADNYGYGALSQQDKLFGGLYNLGYRYGSDLSSNFTNPEAKIKVFRKDSPYDQSENRTYGFDTKDRLWRRVSKMEKQSNGTYRAYLANTNKYLNLGQLKDPNNPMTLNPITSFTAPTFTNYDDTFNSLFNLHNQDNRASRNVRIFLNPIIAMINDAHKNKNHQVVATTDNEGVQRITLYGVDGRNIVITYKKGATGSLNNPNNIAAIQYNYVQKNKEGGVLKAQQGMTLSYNPQQTGTMSLNKEDNERAQNQGQIMTDTDKVRLYSSIVDLTSAAAGFVPGLNLASVATGAASSVTDFGADMADFSNNRPGTTFLGSLGRLGLNLGMDAISLVPTLKVAKAGNALKNIAKWVPYIAGSIQTYNLITDPQLRASMGNTLSKVSQMDISKFNAQDFRNLAYLGRTVLAGKSITSGVKGKITKGKPTGESTFEATSKVKVGDKELEYKFQGDKALSIENSKLKKFSTNKASAEEVARTATREQLAKQIDDNTIKLTEGATKESMLDDLMKNVTVSVNTGSFGKVAASKVRETSESNVGPKNVFEGRFHSKGYRVPWVSDSFYASKYPAIARLYGTQTDNEIKQNRINQEIKAKETAAKQEADALTDKINTIRETAKTDKVAAKLVKDKTDEQLGEQYKTKEEFQEALNTEKDRLNTLSNKLDTRHTKALSNLVNSEIANGNSALAKFNQNSKLSDSEILKAFREADGKTVTQKKEAAVKALIELQRSKLSAINAKARAARKAAKEAAAKIKPVEKVIEPTPKTTAKSGEQLSLGFKTGGVLSNKDERVFELFNKYKNGGLILKASSGVKTPINYLDWQNNVYDDPTNFYDVSGIPKGTIYNGYKGARNDVTWNNGKATLNFNQANYNNNVSNANMGVEDTQAELKNYYSNPTRIMGDVNTFYTNWKKSNPTGTTEDFIKVYNDNVSKTRQWTAAKSKQGINTRGMHDMNSLFNQMHSSYTVGYSPRQDDLLAGGTWRRVDNQFDTSDILKEYRRGQGDLAGLYMDNAGFLRNMSKVPLAGNEGLEPENKPERITDPSEFATTNPINSTGIDSLYGNRDAIKTPGHAEVDKGSLMGLTGVGLGLLANTLATNKLLDSEAAYKQAPWINRYVFGNYPAIAQAWRNAGELNRQASIPISSDASTQMAWMQEANQKGLNMINEANNQNYDTYMKSRAEAQGGQELNEQNRVQVGNDNEASRVAMANLKRKLKADLITSNVSGNIKPWLDENRAYYNQATNQLRNAKLSAALQLADLNSKEDTVRIQQPFLQKALNDATINKNDATGTRKSDAVILAEYLNKYPEEGKAYNGARLQLQRDTIENQLRVYREQDQNYGSPFQWVPGQKSSLNIYDYSRGKTLLDKKGGVITAQDKAKIQSIKDFNKAQLSDSKESIKSIIENQKEFGKTYRSMSAGTLHLLKRALK